MDTIDEFTVHPTSNIDFPSYELGVRIGQRDMLAKCIAAVMAVGCNYHVDLNYESEIIAALRALQKKP